MTVKERQIDLAGNETLLQNDGSISVFTAAQKVALATGGGGGGGNVAVDTLAAASKATPVDTDLIPLIDSAASNVLKKLTWANLKATAKSYFDTLYRSSTTAINLAGSDVTGTLPTGNLPNIIQASIVPRNGADSVISATAGNANEIAITTDTNVFYLLNGVAGGAKKIGGGVSGDAFGNLVITPKNTTKSGTNLNNLVLTNNDASLNWTSGVLLISNGGASSVGTSNTDQVKNILAISAGGSDPALGSINNESLLLGSSGPFFSKSNDLISISTPSSAFATEWQLFGIQTINATPATLKQRDPVLGNFTVNITIGPLEYHDIVISAVSGNNRAVFRRQFSTDGAGALITVKPASPDDIKSSALASSTVEITVSAGVLNITVTGIAATTINWRAISNVLGFSA